VRLRPFRHAIWTKAGYAFAGLALVTIAFVSGCSGGSIASHATVTTAGPAEAAATAAPAAHAMAACSPSASLPPQTMNASGGTLTIPSCGPFYGVLAYPSFGGNAGTISANLVASLRNDIGSRMKNANTQAILYISLTLTSSDPSDTSVTFAPFVAGGTASCGEIDGTFTKDATYYTQGEFPFSAGVNSQTTPGVGSANSFQGAGCVLDGESLTLGAHNFIALSPSAG
jgi:hypothetical protein